jgi:hypothetical protein
VRRDDLLGPIVFDAEREARGDDEEASDDGPIFALDLDRERRAGSEQGRPGWLREGRRQLDELRRRQARPIARSRTERWRDLKQRLEEQHRVELGSNPASEA